MDKTGHGEVPRDDTSDNSDAAGYPVRAAVPPQPGRGGGGGDEDGRLGWKFFDEKGYIGKTRVQAGEDAYKRNKFNQITSDNLKSDRSIPDTRHARYGSAPLNRISNELSMCN